MTDPLHRVVVPVFDAVQPLDVVGPHEVLRIATYLCRLTGRRGGYEVETVGVLPGVVRSETGLALVADGTLPRGPIGTLLVPGGGGARRSGPSGSAGNEGALVAWIQEIAPECERILTVSAVAARAGFGSAETLRRAFLRRLGVAPDHYRRRFSQAG